MLRSKMQKRLSGLPVHLDAVQLALPVEALEDPQVHVVRLLIADLRLHKIVGACDYLRLEAQHLHALGGGQLPVAGSGAGVFPNTRDVAPDLVVRFLLAAGPTAHHGC